jgi:hypothetical protein
MKLLDIVTLLILLAGGGLFCVIFKFHHARELLGGLMVGWAITTAAYMAGWLKR